MTGTYRMMVLRGCCKCLAGRQDNFLVAYDKRPFPADDQVPFPLGLVVMVHDLAVFPYPDKVVTEFPVGLFCGHQVF